MNLLDSGQPWIPTGEQSGLQTRIAATESGSLCAGWKADGFSGTRIGDSRLRRIGLTIDAIFIKTRRR